MSGPRRTRAVLAAVLLAAGLSACAPVVALQPAQDAASPDCAPVTVRLPDELAGLPARETNAQATGAWGDPAAIVLHCGVEVPPPTAELPCYTVEGIDWLVDAKDAPVYVLTTYGRDPAVSIAMDSTVVSSATVLDGLSPAVSWLPENGRACISAEDG